MNLNTQAKILEFLLKSGFRKISFSMQPGVLQITTDREIVGSILETIEFGKPVGVHMVYKTFSCYCFGPPVKDCPVHFVESL